MVISENPCSVPWEIRCVWIRPEVVSPQIAKLPARSQKSPVRTATRMGWGSGGGGVPPAIAPLAP